MSFCMYIVEFQLFCPELHHPFIHHSHNTSFVHGIIRHTPQLRKCHVVTSTRRRCCPFHYFFKFIEIDVFFFALLSMQGPEGTGKTFFYKSLVKYLWDEGKQVTGRLRGVVRNRCNLTPIWSNSPFHVQDSARINPQKHVWHHSPIDSRAYVESRRPHHMGRGANAA